MNDRSSLDQATRIAAGDDRTNYDNVAMTLHWATALLVLCQFALAETWDWFSRGTREAMQSTHVSFGVLLAAVVVARLIWRWIPGHQRAAIVGGWVKIASKGVHYLLYLLLVVQACLGFAIGWSGGHPIHFFGLPIPNPMGALPRPMRGELRDIHSFVGWTIVVVAFGHALAALYHHYRLRDRVLGRMWPPARRTERSAAKSSG
jgi:cytochrome b561